MAEEQRKPLSWELCHAHGRHGSDSRSCLWCHSTADESLFCAKRTADAQTKLAQMRLGELLFSRFTEDEQLCVRMYLRGW